jgi:hypothetical protein
MKRNILRSNLFVLYFLQYLNAQNLGNSPYTQLGIGEIYSECMQRTNQMGEAGSVSASSNFINNLNPAILAHNQYTIMDFSIAYRAAVLNEKKNKEFTQGANFIHAALLLPITKRWSSLISIQPFSTVNYSIQGNNTVVNDTNFYTFNFKGRGGLSNFLWSNGFKISNNFYFGVEGAYLFGKIDDEYRSKLNISEFDNVVLKYNWASFMRVKPGIVLTFFQYKKNAESNNSELKTKKYWIKKDSTFKPTGKQFSLGISLEQFKNINSSQIITLQKIDFQDRRIILDTLTKNGNYKINLPENIRFGVSYEKKGQWSYVADMKLGMWSNYSNDGRNSEKLKNTIIIGLGSERFKSFKIRSVERFYQLRYGLYYAELPFRIQSEMIKEYAFTFGFSFLLPKIKGEGLQFPKFINVGFCIGTRGKLQDGFIREDFLRLNIGVTVNDIWFIRPRID